MRWPRQAAALLLRCPEVFLILYAATFAMGLINVVAIGYLPWIGVRPLTMGVTAAGCATAGLFAVSRISAADGRGGGISLSDPAIRALIGVTGLASVLIWSLSVIAHQSTAGSMGGAGLDFGTVGTIFSFGSLSLNTALLACIFVNPLWIPLVPTLGTGLEEARITNHKMMRKMFGVWFAFPMTILLGGNLAISLAPALAPAALTVLISWLYVAAREIFGGISENGRVESRATSAA